MADEKPLPPPPKPSLTFPPSSRTRILTYLPTTPSNSKPFLTLTFAHSLDSKISLAPGTQTVLSGPDTKAMTHYLRSAHDAILVGAGTALADDPALNCRLEGVGLEGQPRPVVLDSRKRWDVVEAECTRLAYAKRGKGPWVFSTWQGGEFNPAYVECLDGCGGEYIPIVTTGVEMDWRVILHELWKRGIKSVMVEGGAKVINTLLSEKYIDLVDSVIITIAPVWLGEGGVTVSPPHAITSDDESPKAAARLEDVKWQQYGNDVVLCGRVQR